MTHHIVENRPHQKANSLLDHAKNESELSALLVEQLRRAPTLREAAREMLVDALTKITACPNPDALFIHGGHASGSDPAPLAMTDVLLHALLGDTAYLDDQKAVLSMRKDSADPAYGLPGLDMAVVRNMFVKLLKMLPGFFKFRLNEYWLTEEQTFTQIPGEDAVTGTRDHVFETLQSWVFGHAIRLGVGKGELESRDEARLLTLVDEADATGRYALSLRTAEGAVLPLIGTYVATASDVDVLSLADDGAHAGVYLFSPAGGVEKFTTLREMETALQQRLVQSDSRDVLLGYLSLEHQVLTADHPASALQFDYSPFKEKPAAHFIASLREKQLNDFSHLLTHAPWSGGEPEALLQMFDDASRLDDLEQALHVRYLDLLEFMQEQALPGWLRFAATADRLRYDTLAAEQARCEAQMQALLVGIETPEIYARQEIAAYLMKHLGYTLDPAKVMVNLPDEMPFADAPLKAVYRNTLLSFALDGMPDVELRFGPGIEVDPAYSHLHLDFDFVLRLVQDLDLKQRYGREVERRYREQATLTAMNALRASNIALSAWAAKLQGHLSDRGLALIERAQSSLDGMPAIQMGGLYLKSCKRRLEDAVVIREVNADDEFYVLYAPGQPNGRDMFDFDTWRKLSMEVGSWTGDARGAQYLLDQTVDGAHQEVVSYVESIRLKPSRWSNDNVQFVAVYGGSLTGALSGLS